LIFVSATTIQIQTNNNKPAQNHFHSKRPESITNTKGKTHNRTINRVDEGKQKEMITNTLTDINTILVILSYYVSLHYEFRVMMFVAITA